MTLNYNGGDLMDLLKNNSRLIFDSLSVPIYLIDQQYNIIDFNRACIDHFNLSKENIIGQPCYKIAHNSDIPCTEQKGTICAAKASFKNNERCHTIHKHFINDRVVVEEVISTPINNGQYVLEEFRDLSDLLGLVQGILLICAGCKKIRDRHGNWYKIEGYLHDKTGADFSHLICPECAKRLYPEFMG